MPHDTNLNKCEAAPYFAAHTLAFNGATRHSLLPSLRVSTCNLEVIFNAGAALASHLRQLSGAVRDVYSSSSMFFALDTRAIKKPLHFRGYSFFAFSPHLAEIFRRNWHPLLQLRRAGCRASKGRIPPPLLMRSVHAAYSFVYVLTIV